MKKRHEQKLVILSIALLMLFNAPILLLFNSSKIFLGLPLVYVYMFGIWLFSIAISYFIFKKYDE